MDADRNAAAGSSGAMTVVKVAAAAQATTSNTIATTQVTDTIYRADGTPANGTVIVSWQAFTTASGQAVRAGPLLRRSRVAL